MKLLEEKSLGNKLPFYSEQPRSLFHELLGHFQSSDDTVVFLLILFLKTLRHSKYISHVVAPSYPRTYSNTWASSRPTRTLLNTSSAWKLGNF